MIQWIIDNVYSWLINPAVWLSAGPIAQIILVALVILAILQALPDSFAGGALFGKTGCWITLCVLALYVLIVFVVPFISLNIQFAVPALALLAVIVIVILAIFAKKNLH